MKVLYSGIKISQVGLTQANSYAQVRVASPHEYHNNTTSSAPTAQQKALQYAERGKPVFPCVPGDKAPLTKRGFKDATTDQRKIHMWFKRHPEANIAIPTGKISGVWVLDVDGEEGRESLEALERKHGLIPPTLRVRTGSGGEHLYFAYPDDGQEIRNSAKDIAPGLDVRGDGGYILLPPSATTGEYRMLEKREPAPAPAWLLEAARKRPEAGAANLARPRKGTPIPEGEPIPEGQRNHGLTSICGRLHDGSRNLAELTADLLAVNAERCAPSLPEAEVLKIAASIFGRDPCRPSGKAPAAVVGVLGEVLTAWWQTPWPGIGGKTRRDVLLAWIVEAMRHGRITDDGDVALSISVRQTAKAARCGKSSALRAIKWLREKGWISGGANGPARRPDHAAGIVLKRARKVGHLHPQSSVVGIPLENVPPCAPSTRRGRHSAPGLKREATKSAITVVDHLEAAGDWISEEDLADRLGVSRARDVRRRYLEPLEDAGVVEYTHTAGGRLWRLTEASEEATAAMFERDEELERGAYDGYTSDERQDREDALARKKFREGPKYRPDESPTERDMEERRGGWQDRQQASGEIADLERVRVLPLDWFYARMGQTVETEQGRGRLWQALSERVGVVLNNNPNVVTYMHPVDVLGDVGEVA